MSLKILFISFVFVGVIKISEANHNNTDLCCSSLNSTECTQCKPNVTFCCNNQPYTIHTEYSPFCCSYGEECCGNGKCCQENQVCCIGWNNNEGTCCDADKCSPSGECNTGKDNGRPLWEIIVGVLIILVPLFCIYLCCRVRRHMNRNRVRRGLGYRLAQTESDDLQQNQVNDILPSLIRPSLNDDNYNYSIPPEFLGLPPKTIKLFPTMSWQDDSNGSPKKPESNLNNNESYIEEYSEYMCSICLDNYAKDEKLRLLPCAHVYHASCIDLWFKKSTTCPLCKADFSAYEYQ